MKPTPQNENFHPENVQHAKMTLSGNRLRLVEIAPFDPNERKKNTLKKQKQKKLKCGRFTSSLIRSRSRVTEHILNNFKPRQSTFLTLTYKENVTKERYEETVADLQRFLRVLRKKYPNIKYLAVAELQKRGAIHFHILTNKKRIPLDWLDFSWGHGFVFIKQTYGHPSKMANYVAKYISKETFLPVMKKTYFISRNLTKSLVVSGIFKAYSAITNFLKMSSGYSVDNSFVFSTNFAKIQITDFYLETG